MALGFPRSEAPGRGVQMIPSTSEAISAYGYDLENQELYILPRKRASRVYIYKGFPPDQMAEFLAAESMGRFWALTIKPNYEVR